MKQLTILILLSAGILCSCEEPDPEISVVDYLVIGDKNAAIFLPDTSSVNINEVTTPPPFSGSCTTYSLLDLDLDSDGSYDFRFRYALGPYWVPYQPWPDKPPLHRLCLAEIWSIECLSSESRIDCFKSPDSINNAQHLYPVMLEFMDTLRVQSDWFSCNNHWSAMSGASHLFPLVIHYHYYPFYDPIYDPRESPWVKKGAPVGDWYGAENKYIGVKLEKANGVYLGWIQVSVINSGIVVHEMGSKKLY
jgi:hypothetical protein